MRASYSKTASLFSMSSSQVSSCSISTSVLLARFASGDPSRRSPPKVKAKYSSSMVIDFCGGTSAVNLTIHLRRRWLWWILNFIFLRGGTSFKFTILQGFNLLFGFLSWLWIPMVRNQRKQHSQTQILRPLVLARIWKTDRKTKTPRTVNPWNLKWY